MGGLRAGPTSRVSSASVERGLRPWVAAGLLDERFEVVAVGLLGEIVRGEAGRVVGGEVGEVLLDEAQEGGAGAGFEEQWLGGEEAGASFGGAGGHFVQGFGGIGDAGEERRAKNPGGQAGFAQMADSLEAQVGAGVRGARADGPARRRAS